MQVEIHNIQNGEDNLAGVLRLEGGKIVAEPDIPLLRNILDAPAMDYETGKFCDADDSPEQFLRALHGQYRSAYLRAGQAKA